MPWSKLFFWGRVIHSIIVPSFGIKRYRRFISHRALKFWWGIATASPKREWLGLKRNLGMNQTHSPIFTQRSSSDFAANTLYTFHGFWHSTDPILSPGHALAVLQPPHLWRDRNIDTWSYCFGIFWHILGITSKSSNRKTIYWRILSMSILYIYYRFHNHEYPSKPILLL